MILTPDNDPFFHATLRGVLPPDFSPQENLILDSDSGILIPVGIEGFKDYVFGGQYDADLDSGVLADG